MELGIFVIRDSAADSYGRPFFCPAVGIAVRNFSDEINRPGEGNMFYQHPADFELFHLGMYDDLKASFLLLDMPESIARGQDLVQEADSRQLIK